MSPHTADAPQEPGPEARHEPRSTDRAYELAASVTPGRHARLGAAAAVIGLAVCVAAFLSWRSSPGLGAAGDVALGALAALLAIAAVTVVTVIALALARRLPAVLTGVLLGAAVVITYVLVLPDTLEYAIGAGAVLLVALLGGLVYSLAKGSHRDAGRGRRAAVGATLAIAAVAVVCALIWIAWPGSDAHKSAATAVANRAVAQLNAPDPSQPGPFEVGELTYGSGDDRLRPEFGADAALVTSPVNGSPFVQWTGIRQRLLEWRWGFDTSSLPLNARVWYPAGEGPFPLVLVVHGNHNLFEFSDPGYAYLGELLASRGYIVASVDENFLNGGVYGSSRGENDARSWLLLKHLETWRDWHRAEGNPFSGKVDLDRIALIGHSRGGEAVATAAAMNALEHHPDNALRRFDFGFGIRSVIAFAPSDGQYKPAGRLNELADVSYLVFHGADDSDVANFSGLRQYQRLDLGDGKTGDGVTADVVAESGPQRPFKAALYVDQANHGQFNSVWGRRDRAAPTGWLLNTKPLMPGDEQRRLAMVYISAFLEDTLREEDAYRPLFRDHNTGIAAGWLPETEYISRYADPGHRVAAGFEEDLDVTTATVDDSTIEARGLAVWREKLLKFRTGKSQENSAAVIGWATPDGSYAVSLPPGQAQKWGLAEESLLVLAVAEADQARPGRPADADGGDGSSEPGPAPLDLSVAVTDEHGVTASVPLSDFGAIPRPIRSRLTKLPHWEARRYRSETQPILQSVEIPLSAFVYMAPELDLASLSTVKLLFDRSPAGVILLDDLGFDVDG